MTNQAILDRLAFDEAISGVEILKEEHPEPGMTFVVASVNTDTLGTIIVPFVIPDNEDCVFTPRDWQAAYTANFSLADIADVEWRIDDTDQEAVILNGLPRTFAGAAQSLKIAARRRFAKELKAAREVKGYTIRDVETVSGIPHSQYCRIEAGRGNPTFDSLVRLAAALDTTFTIGGD